MKQIGIFEGKAQFSALIDAAEHGETIIITKRGKPVARIVPADDAVDRAVQTIKKRKLMLKRGEKVRDLVEEGRKY